MAWVRIDDGFAQHPKVVSAGPLAMAMQIAALCYCNKNLTDGFLPRAVVPTLLNLEGIAVGLQESDHFVSGSSATWQDIVSDLLRCGLWEEAERGYKIHDYLDWNLSKDDVLTLRAARADAGRMGGLAKAKASATADAKQTPKQNRSKVLPPSPSPSPSDSPAPAKEDGQALAPPASPPVPVASRPPKKQTEKEPGAAYLDTKAPPNGLDNPDRVRRAFYLLWEKKYEVPYAQEPPKDRAWALALLKQHKAMGIQVPWLEWAPKIIAGYLEMDDDDLVKKDRHTMNHLTRKLNAIRANIGGAA